MVAAIFSRSTLTACWLMAVVSACCWPVPVSADQVVFGVKADKTLRIFGDDNRDLVTETTEFPWSAIGMVEAFWFRGNGTVTVRRGTGTMIGDRIVLTCAHSLFDLADGWADEMYFSPGKNGNQEPFGRIEAERSLVLSQWVNNSVNEYDIAMMVLTEPIGRQTGRMAFSVEPESFFVDKALNSAGYPGEVMAGDRLYRVFGLCQGLEDGFIRNELDSTPGQSGSPFWYFQQGTQTRKLVGVLTGSREVTIGEHIVEVYNVAIRINQTFADWINQQIELYDVDPVDDPADSQSDTVEPHGNAIVLDSPDSGYVIVPGMCGAGFTPQAMLAICILGVTGLCRRRQEGMR